MKTNRLLSDEELRGMAHVLVEGGAVEIDGHWVRFKSTPACDDPCARCMMEKVCRAQMVYLCLLCVEMAESEGHLTLNF